MIAYDFHSEVSRDLDAIWDFIGADNPEAADWLIAEIVDAIDALVPFPHVGHRRPDLTGRPVRFISGREYLITYAPEEKPFWVVAAMHGRAQPARDGRGPHRQGVTVSVAGPTISRS